MLDIGTGDGQFVWKSARQNRSNFYIGLDSNRSNLEKISEKIYRKESKGGASNALFIEASLENIPPELDGIMNEVQIQFPWGSLLQAVATGDSKALSRLKRICAPDATLKVILSLDPVRDRSEMALLNIPQFDLEYIRETLIARYEMAGFYIKEARILTSVEVLTLKSSWAKRIHGPNRLTFLMKAKV